MRTKPLTQKEILADILVTTKYTLKVLGGFVISGIVSVFGLYPLVASFFKSETALYITIVGFIGLLILIDSIKRSTLARYYNSKLKNIILASRVRGSYLNISIMSIVFVLLIDGSGAWLTGVSGAKYYTENKTTNSEEYKLLQANAKNGTSNKQMYLTLKSDYNTLRANAVDACNQKWRVPRYRTKNGQCVDKWDNNNKPPSQELLSQKSEVSTADYKNIADENKGFLDEYLQYIIFTVLILLTGLLQYLTISEIKEDYEDLEDSLTASRVTNIRTALATAQDIEEHHEKKTFEDKGEMQKKKYEQLRDMDGIEDKREIVFNAKSIKHGNNGLQLIANNSNDYVPTDEAKAGFVVNPFGDEGDNNQSVKTKTVNDEAEQNNPQTKAVNDEDRQDEENKKLNMNDFEFLHRNMIALLFKGDTINRHDRLRTRDEVVKILHKQGHGRIRDLNTSMTELYTKLIEMNVIYKKVAYFSNMDKGIL